MIMKSRIVILLSLLLISVIAADTASAQLNKGTKSVGIKTGYVTLNKTATAGIELQYAFSRHFVLAPGIDMIFRNENLDGMMFNLDYHGPWQLDKDGRWYFYHILGANYASWSSHLKNVSDQGSDDKNDDVTQRTNRFGLDFGAGVEYYVRPTLKLSLLGKFNWLKGYNTGLFNLGISYVF